MATVHPTYEAERDALRADRATAHAALRAFPKGDFPAIVAELRARGSVDPETDAIRAKDERDRIIEHVDAIDARIADLKPLIAAERKESRHVYRHDGTMDHSAALAVIIDRLDDIDERLERLEQTVGGSARRRGPAPVTTKGT